MRQTAAGETMLHLAARADMPVLAQLLLDLGADYRIHNGCGMTALHVAAWLGHAQIVTLLLNRTFARVGRFRVRRLAQTASIGGHVVVRRGRVQG